MKSVLSLLHQPAMSAEKRWRQLRGLLHLADVIANLRFADGVEGKKKRAGRPLDSRRPYTRFGRDSRFSELTGNINYRIHVICMSKTTPKRTAIPKAIKSTNQSIEPITTQNVGMFKSCAMPGQSQMVQIKKL